MSDSGIKSGSSPSSAPEAGTNSLRPDIIAFLTCYFSLIGAAIGFFALLSAVLAIQLR